MTCEFADALPPSYPMTHHFSMSRAIRALNNNQSKPCGEMNFWDLNSNNQSIPTYFITQHEDFDGSTDRTGQIFTNISGIETYDSHGQWGAGSVCGIWMAGR